MDISYELRPLLVLNTLGLNVLKKMATLHIKRDKKRLLQIYLHTHMMMIVVLKQIQKLIYK